MRAIIGLGNPGRSYRLTRHNIGFILLDYIQKFLNLSFRPGKGDYYIADSEIAGIPVLLVKPTTYMNLSGNAVKQLLENYPLAIDDLFIVYDDFHLPFGELRFRVKGSSGGHKGIDSIIFHLQSEDFTRLKIGIGSPFENAVDFVLSKFEPDEKKRLEELMQKSFEAITIWLMYGLEKAMNQFNRNLFETGNN